MKAMIFAAGIGSRLKPFTDYHPKALATVGKIPMLERVILKLKDAGIRQMVVNVHHFANQITDFLKANGNFGCDIAISDERRLLLDTGGGLLNARKLFDSYNEPILLHNADILTDFQINDMLQFHETTNSDITLMVSRRESSRMLYFNACGLLHGWQNLKTGEIKPEGFVPVIELNPLAFGGVHIVTPGIFELLSEYKATQGDVFSIIPFYLANLHNLTISGFQPKEPFRWFDVGSASKLAEADGEFNI